MNARPSERLIDIDRALRLEWLTLGWMVVEAVVAIGAGVVAHSLALEAFGLDSVIELASAVVLIWRLRVELKQGATFPPGIERSAARVGGVLLFALTTYVIAGSVRALWMHQAQATSVPGLVVTGVAVPAMYLLARTKLTLADRLHSAALRADAVESLTCGYLSVVVFLSLLAQWWLGMWWLAGVSALVLVPFLLHEAREAWTGDACCVDD
ncbi:MAG TPA: cation transporter [Vicinamibacterales bacterium]|nr:cation transporter [Vicinamibacterales bacterium]